MMSGVSSKQIGHVKGSSGVGEYMVYLGAARSKVEKRKGDLELDPIPNSPLAVDCLVRRAAAEEVLLLLSELWD